MTTARILTTAAFTMTLMAAAPAARATPEPGAAKASADLGWKLFDAGRFGEAELAFRDAYAEDPLLKYAFNRAKSAERDGRPEDALVHLESLLEAHEVELANNGKLRKRITKLADGLRKKLKKTHTEVWFETVPAGAVVALNGKEVAAAPLTRFVAPGEHQLSATAEGYLPGSMTVVVTKQRRQMVRLELLSADTPGRIALDGAAEGAVVTLDGAVVGTAPLEPFEAAPGAHVVLVELAGHAPFHAQIEVEATETTTVKVPTPIALVVTPPKPDEPTPETVEVAEETDEDGGGVPLASWILWGSGAAVAAVGGVLGGVAWFDKQEAAADYANHPPDPFDWDHYRSLKDETHAFANASYVLYGVGAAAAVTGLVLLFVLDEEAPEARSDASVVRLSPGPGGLSVSF